jgi:hypothetical protein
MIGGGEEWDMESRQLNVQPLAFGATISGCGVGGALSARQVFCRQSFYVMFDRYLNPLLTGQAFMGIGRKLTIPGKPFKSNTSIQQIASVVLKWGNRGK